MFLGVDHVGVGVSDMDAARRFYGDLGFTVVAFQYVGPLAGLERVTKASGTEARVVMLRNQHPRLLGSGASSWCRCRRARSADSRRAGMGERGICEVCVHVRGQRDFYRWLVEERGYESLMEPCEAPNQPPNNTHADLSYVADPEGGKVELIEWRRARLAGPTRAAWRQSSRVRCREYRGQPGVLRPSGSAGYCLTPTATSSRWIPGSRARLRVST